MIRITFVVGGGKNTRGRYDDKAMQAVTSTLNQLDFAEDRGASCIMECGGCYKTQHDTAKNNITVVVFPKVSEEDGKHQINRGKGDEDYEPLIPTHTPGYKLAVCNIQPTFHNLLSTYCPTYFEKRECLHCLEGLLEVEQAIENKMMNGQPLDAGEQAFYDECSDLKEKYTTLQKEISKHIEDGRLTIDEKHTLVEMNEKRTETLMAEKSSAVTAEKLKKALARKKQLHSLTDEVLSLSTSYPPPLRHESQITTLRKKLLPLQTLEESSKGRLLTLKETRSLTEKEEIENEIERLEMASCGWFEEVGAFEARVQQSRDKFDGSNFAKRRTQSGGGKTTSRGATGKSSGSGGSSTVNKWILPGEKPKSSAWGGTSKNKVKAKGGAIFTAMMMSDSEEEESDEDESIDDTKEGKFNVVSTKKQQQKQHPAVSNILATANSNGCTDTAASKATNVGQSKKNKKKKKKKGKASTTQQTTDDVEDTQKQTTVSSSISSPSSSATTVSSSLIAFWRFVWPILLWLLSLLVSLVLSMFRGKDKKSGKKKRG